MGDDARRTILSRRARFVAAAMITTAVAATDCKPRPCLDIVKPLDEDDAAISPRVCLSQPMVCLSPVPRIEDAGGGGPDPGGPIGPPLPPDAGPDGAATPRPRVPPPKPG